MWEFDDAQLEADWVVEDPRLRYLAGVGARIRQEASQVDLPAGQVSGLVEASRILTETPGIVQVRFSHEDVVRHELVARIVKAYDDDSRDR